MPRSINLPAVVKSALSGAKAIFGGPGNSDDWRVRLSIPNNSTFKSSYVLTPLKDAGGLVFPFTPQIAISSSASYDDVSPMHQNFQFHAYQHSRASAITITCPFVSEDSVQAQYWIAVLHFLRSVTKMYTGDTDAAGSPPPILSLNGYGDYVFKNVPVVVKDFTIDLPQDVDYIPTTISQLGSTLAEISSSLGMVSSIASSFGGQNAISKVAGKIGNLAGTATGIAGKVTSLFGGQGVTYVPVKSSFTVTLLPIYSRDSARTFSLKDFVNGKYVGGSGGYI